MSRTPFRKTMAGTVVSVFQAEVAGLAGAPEDGKPFEVERRKGDWYVRLEGSSAVRIGGPAEKPDLQEGDTVVMTLERRDV